MTVDFLSRIIGMIAFALLAARLGNNIANSLKLSAELTQATSFIFSLVGVLFGLIVTPWVTIRPLRSIRKSINELPIEKLITVLLGAVVGLGISLLLAYPLSLLDDPLGKLLPPVVSVLSGYLGMAIFSARSREFTTLFSEWFGGKRNARLRVQSDRQLLLDTSVLIDGRLVDVAETGFLGGTLVIPRFVLTELHQVADSADTLRRNRGRRGLQKLNELQHSNLTPVKIIEDDIEDIPAVDNKLVALALQMNAALITNDYNLNQVAEAQGVMVLNINELANAVKTMLIPGETIPIHVIQEGRDPGQGVGYLEDGTMVVVENGKQYMDRTIRVTVTRVINRPAGRMIFAMPENHKG